MCQLIHYNNINIQNEANKETKLLTRQQTYLALVTRAMKILQFLYFKFGQMYSIKIKMTTPFAHPTLHLDTT